VWVIGGAADQRRVCGVLRGPWALRRCSLSRSSITGESRPVSRMPAEPQPLSCLRAWVLEVPLVDELVLLEPLTLLLPETLPSLLLPGTC
jgi:hypothetical protein